MITRMKNAWKQQLYRDDVTYTLINGFISAIIFGVLLGLINGFLFVIDFPVGVAIIFIGIFVGKRIRKSYYNYHVLYPTLSVVFSIFSYIFYEIGVLLALYVGAKYSFLDSLGNAFSVLLQPTFYKSLITNPYYILRYGSAEDIIYEVIDIIFFCLMIYFAYKYSKKNN